LHAMNVEGWRCFFCETGRQMGSGGAMGSPASGLLHIGYETVGIFRFVLV